MGLVAIVAVNTFREAVRDRILYNLVFFALLMIGAAVLVGQISLGIERLIIINLGLSSISIFGIVMAVFLGVGGIHKEMERRTLYSVLAKPVSRWQFLLGKYAGLCLTLAVNICCMTAGLFLALWYVEGALRISDAAILRGVFLIALQLFLTTAIALFFSCFATPVVATLGALGLYVAGVFAEDIRGFGELSESAGARAFTTVLYYALPNFNQFNVISAVTHGKEVPAALLGFDLLYAALYAAILMSGAVAVFSNRNLK